MNSCPNLQELFGDKYQIVWDESRPTRSDDPWYQQIACKWGHICPSGPNELLACIDGFPKYARHLRKLSCCTIVQDGDSGEVSALFSLKDFKKVARVMKPRRKCQLTDEQKRIIADRLMAGREAKSK